MLEIIIIILLAVVIFEGLLVYFSLKRISQYEKIIAEVDNIIEYITEQVKVLDSKGTFKSDDEIGFFWEAITTMSKLLNNLFEKEDVNAKAKN
tara:strand:+ start:3847 stop:4125 length:279 start_codon:yes stop_codon:yes gene_type:complete